MGGQNEELKKYSDCLLEIKRRMEVLRGFLEERVTTGFLVTNVEFICLQFRKVIELIALSSLVANKEEYSKQNKKFAEKWNAKEIFRDLEQINPNFYPEPTKQGEERKLEDLDVIPLDKIDFEFLTKEKAIKVYNKCSKVLHAENPYNKRTDIRKVYSEFTQWYNEVIRLLNHHCITLYGNKYMIIGKMQSDDGNPKAFLFKNVGKTDGINILNDE